MHRAVLKEQVINLRKAGYSYLLISRKTGLSKSTLSDWLSTIEYTPNQETLELLGKARAASSESKARLRRNSIAKAKSEAAQEISSLTRRDLFLYGLGLYLGEGSKTGNQVRVVNADPKVILLVVCWFKSLGIKVEQFAPRLHLYPDTDVSQSLQFWSQMTTIPKTQFQSSYIDRRTDKKAMKQGKLPFGTLHLGVRSGGKKEFGVFLSRKIQAWNDEVLKKVAKAGLV